MVGVGGCGVQVWVRVQVRMLRRLMGVLVVVGVSDMRSTQNSCLDLAHPTGAQARDVQAARTLLERSGAAARWLLLWHDAPPKTAPTSTCVHACTLPPTALQIMGISAPADGPPAWQQRQQEEEEEEVQAALQVG